MSTKQNNQQVAKNIAHVNSRLSELARPIAELHNEEAVLKARIETIEQDIASRDWIFSGHRPRGSSESVSQAEQTRRQLHIELKQAASCLGDLQRLLTPLKREQSQLRCELSYLEQAAITPEQLQPEIDALEAVLADLQSQRAGLEKSLEEDQTRLELADEAEHEVVAAAERLATARANSFLATTAEKGALDEACSKAEDALALAREKASGARAARPIISALIEKTKAALSSLDEQIEQQQARLSEKQSQQRKLVALAEWDRIVEQARIGLHNLLEADRKIGRALVEALMREGLKEFDYTGRLIRPEWLPSLASGLNRN